MFVYVRAKRSQPVVARSLPRIKQQLEAMSTQDLDSLKTQLKIKRSSCAPRGDIQSRSIAMDQIPPLVLVPMFDSYFKARWS